MFDPKNFESKKCLSPKNFWVQKTFQALKFRSKQILVPKLFGSQNTLGPKTLWVPKKFGSKKNFVKKKIFHKNFWGQNNFFELKRKVGLNFFVFFKSICPGHSKKNIVDIYDLY